jgi:hypothetical protein
MNGPVRRKSICILALAQCTRLRMVDFPKTRLRLASKDGYSLKVPAMMHLAFALEMGTIRDQDQDG